MSGRLTNTIVPDDERAVSPVIGVILMVAIAVLLAAVIGTFVLDFGGDQAEGSPQASLSVSTDTSLNNITISHNGGDGLASGDTRIIVENSSGGEMVFNESAGGTFSVGDSMSIDTPNRTITSGPAGFEGRVASEGFEVNSGQQYTVTVIDTATQRTIYQTTVTA